MSWAAGFTALPLPTGATEGGVYAVSADGTVAVGFVGYPSRLGAYWTSTGGFGLVGPSPSEAFGVNVDGSVIIGDSEPGRPFHWTLADGFSTYFGTTGDGIEGLSADASRAIGSTGDLGSEQACYFDLPAGTRTLLGFLPGHDTSRAMSVSADGSTIVGFSQLQSDVHSLRAFRWTAASGMIDLGVGGTNPSGNIYSRGFGVSDDGLTVVGDTSAPANPGATAFSWTAAGGMVLIPRPSIAANAISGDGSTIMVYSFLPGADPGDGYLGYITAAGLTVPTPVPLDPSDPTTIQGTFPNQNSISADGTVMAGYAFGTNTLPWIFAIPGAIGPSPPSLAMDNVLAVNQTPLTVAGSQIFLEWSDDRGHSYGNPVGQRIGATGRYLTSVQWQRLGYARDRVFRISWSVPVATALQGAWIEFEPAES